jgi:phytol kinase
MSQALITELSRAALIGAAFIGLFLAAELWRKLAAPPVEWTRKLVHFGGGVIAAHFPWLISSHWTVLALGAAFLGILWGTRRLGLLQSVHGVARSSEGGIYFPIAIYVVFLIGSHRPVDYFISVLVLVVADAAAAVLGSAYGRLTYDVERDRRSLEGSTVFFVATFLIVHLSLLLLTDIDRTLSVLAALQIALIVTLFEAISIEGNDNLLVPLATYFLLFKLTQQMPETLQLQLVAQLVIISIIGVMAWRIPFVTGSGAAALTLFVYGAYSLGDPEWVVGPTVGIAAFGLLFARRTEEFRASNPKYQVIAAFYICIVPTLLLLANNIFKTVLLRPEWLAIGDPFYPVFLGACAAQLAIAAWNLEPTAGGSALGMPGWNAESRENPPHEWSLAIGFAFAALVVVIGPGAYAKFSGWSSIGVAAAVALLGPAIYHGARHLSWWPKHPPWNVRLAMASVALGSATVLALLLPLLARR